MRKRARERLETGTRRSPRARAARARTTISTDESIVRTTVSLNCRAQLLRMTMRLRIVIAGKICSGDVSVTAAQYATWRARAAREAGGVGPTALRRTRG